MEREKDLFTSIPHRIMDTEAYLYASYRAKALLFEICRQLNGVNNGQLHVTASWLYKRGWASHDQIQKAKDELLKRGLIRQTRKGGLHRGASHYAVSWLGFPRE